MIISPKVILEDAKEQGYAVPAFSFYNLDILFAVLEAAEEENAPVIVQTYSDYYPFLHHEVIGRATLETIRQTKVAAALHMDHAADYDLLMRAINSGYTSVMIDGSALPLEVNIALTKAVVDVAKVVNVYTEAEVGRSGVDGVLSDDEYADVDACVRLVNETGVDSLAPAVGTADGGAKKVAEINMKRIQEIHDAVGIPLVLHGAYGIPDNRIRQAIDCGVYKIIVGVELKYAWSEAMKDGLLKGEKEPRILSAYARDKVREAARKKLRLFGATGKNPQILKSQYEEEYYE